MQTRFMCARPKESEAVVRPRYEPAPDRSAAAGDLSAAQRLARKQRKRSHKITEFPGRRFRVQNSGFSEKSVGKFSPPNRCEMAVEGEFAGFLGRKPGAFMATR
jgi:hypothetical protein